MHNFWIISKVGFPAFFLVYYMAKQKIKVIREEMLQVANNVAEEKNIDQDSVFSAMEQALEKSARIKYGFERDLRVSINRDTGDIKLNSYLKVVEIFSEEEQSREILLSEAIKNSFKEGIKYNEIPEWDSIAHMTLISSLEEKFSISFEVDDIIAFDSYLKGQEILNNKYKINLK